MEKEIVGLPTGFKALDEKLGGFRKGEVVVITSRPSVGKTSLAMNIAECLSLGHDINGIPFVGKSEGRHAVLYFSLEMSSASFAKRMLCSRAHINAWHLERDVIDEAESATVKVAVADAANEMGQTRLYVEDTANLDIEELCKKAKSMTSRQATYNNNTVSLGGISMRDAFPGLTSKWYGVVPVDLSKDGTQSFPLVASGLYIIGKVNVTVAGDEVTTELEYAASEESVKPQGECLAWFTSADQITGEFLDNPTSDMAFGKAISKSRDLDGKDVALLFVCNKISFRAPFIDGNGPARFVRSAAGMREYLKGLNDLMAKIK